MKLYKNKKPYIPSKAGYLLQVQSQMKRRLRPGSGQEKARQKPSSVMFGVGIVEILDVISFK
jgi:hypothetical protein